MKSPLLDYFDRAACQYMDVEAAFLPLADGLVGFADLKAGERVLDVGTGSGLVARASIQSSCMVFALDFSCVMLAVAREQGVGNLLRSDMHNLALSHTAVDVVLASFALNSTDPARCLSEIWRVLKPGGRVVLQEWGALDPLSELVSDTIADYAVGDPPPELVSIRSMVEIPVPWDDIDGPDDVMDIMGEAGFCDVELEVVQVPVALVGVETFMSYKFAWPDRRAEIDAMPADVRWLCLSDLQENLAAYAEDDDSLIWRPEVFRIRAFKPGGAFVKIRKTDNPS